MQTDNAYQLIVAALTAKQKVLFVSSTHLEGRLFARKFNWHPRAYTSLSTIHSSDQGMRGNIVNLMRGYAYDLVVIDPLNIGEEVLSTLHAAAHNCTRSTEGVTYTIQREPELVAAL